METGFLEAPSGHPQQSAGCRQRGRSRGKGWRQNQCLLYSSLPGHPRTLGLHSRPAPPQAQPTWRGAPRSAASRLPSPPRNLATIAHHLHGSLASPAPVILYRPAGLPKTGNDAYVFQHKGRVYAGCRLARLSRPAPSPCELDWRVLSQRTSIKVTTTPAPPSWP